MINREQEDERRQRLAALPVAEKLRILAKLRDRDRAIAAVGLRKTNALARVRDSSSGGMPSAEPK